MRIPASKLLRPRLGGSVIDRTRLLHPRTADGTVVLLSASAGAGKTTLMTQWARRCMQEGERVAWVTLDAHDNHRVLFWTAVLTAVRGQVDGPTPGDGDVVTVRHLDRRQHLVRLETLVDRAAEPMWLFLDDLQEVSSSAVLADLDQLLRSIPPGLRLVLATRRDPPLGVHRLRVSGQLQEIRAADLALQRSEVRQVLADHQVVLGEPGLTLLMERTEGWAAGVRLAALTLSRTADPEAMVQDFAGDEREVADYLAAEVLGTLPAAERSLLRICAVPEQLTAELALRLTGEPGAPQLLERLYRNNALVEQLAGPGRSYRLHTLLRGYLLADLRRTDPAELSRLHAEAARWFGGRRQGVWALTHAVAAGDPALAVEMLVQHGPTLLAEGRGRLLQQLIKAAPPDVAGVLAVERLAELAALDADPTSAELLVRHPLADPTLEVAQSDGLAALMSLQRARRLDPAASREALAVSEAVDTSPRDDLTLLLRLNRGEVLILSGELDAAQTELDEAARLADATESRRALVRISAALTGLAACRADQRRTWDLAEQTLQLACGVDAVRTPDVAFAVLQAAHVAFQRLDHAAAGQLAGWAQSVAEGTAEPNIGMSAVALRSCVDVQVGVGGTDAARRLRECWALAAGQPTAAVTAVRIAFAQHRCAWLTGHPDWAREALWRLEAAVGPAGDLDVLTATDHLVRGRAVAARRRLSRMLTGPRACVLPTSEQQAWLVEAVLAGDAGEPARSNRALHAALELAEEFDVQHAFLDVPGVGRLLAEDTRRFGRLGDLAERIRLAAAAGAVPDVAALTPRELDVLGDLPTQLTLEEIAEQQQVSLNTVKTHVRAIYQKLAASSRREAVLEARHRGLL